MRIAGVVWGILALAVLCSRGAEPIDPLAKDPREPGAFSWRLGLGYTPLGTSGSEVDRFGIPYTYTRLAHGLELSLGGELQATRNLNLGIDLSDTCWFIRERRGYHASTVERTSQSRAFSYRAYGEALLAPDSPLDPRARVAAGRPEISALEVSVFLIRDPVVLSGGVGHTWRKQAPDQWLSIGLAAGFVANPWVTMSATARLEVALEGTDLPHATLGWTIRYALDTVGDLHLDVQAALHIQESTAFALAMALGGKRP